MNSIKKRFFLPFIAGVLVGVVGCLVIVNIIDNKQQTSLKTEKAYELKPETENIVAKTKNKKKESRENGATHNKNIKEIGHKKTQNEEKQEEADSTQLQAISDTTMKDTLSSLVNIISDSIEINQDEDIVIKKEELLTSLSLELVDIITTANQPENEKDSLIEKISGIKKHPTNKMYKLEYWKSPLNYKGYKMANNKIVIYGLEPSQRATLYMFEKKIYLLHNGVCYNLDNTFAFKPFNQVKDEAIIAQLTE